MARWGHVFPFVAEFLEQLFTRPQPGELDANVAVRRASGELNEVPRKIQNPDWFAHIEQEYLPAGPLCSTLEHQSGSFGDGHKVPGHFRVRHLYRSAGANLPGKNRHDAAGRTENVAEA